MTDVRSQSASASAAVASPSAAEAKRRKEREEDWALVQRAQKGEYEAFEELVSRHGAKSYALALGMLRNPQDAEEVVQDSFLNAFQKLSSFRGDSAFTSWLYRITANNALMRLRKQKRESLNVIEDMLPTFREDGVHAHIPGGWARSADDLVADKQLSKRLEEGLAMLPAQYRVVLLMREVDGLSNEEIAEVMGLSIPAVKSRLHRARLALREHLDKEHQK
ncbi:MAG: sigma-70 family RNA polymerase sigma factor [Myxococcota bacterium]